MAKKHLTIGFRYFNTREKYSGSAFQELLKLLETSLPNSKEVITIYTKRETF